MDKILSTPRNLEPRIGVFVCGCGGNISEVVNVPDVVEYCQELNGVVYSGESGYACTDEAAEEIKAKAKEHNLTHVVLAACACCNLDQICFSCSDRRILCKSNLFNDNKPNDVSYEFINIREHCAWVHHSQPKVATAKAKTLIGAGVARARESQLPTMQAFVTVDQQRCRGCGTCEAVCKFEAILLGEKNNGVFAAQVTEDLCQGCGICVACCPSGALSQSGYSDSQITASLEAILS